MESSSRRALDAALAVAREHGLPTGDAPVVRDLTNVIVHLRPAPVVARVPTVFDRRGRDGVSRQVDVARFLAAESAPVAPVADEVDPGPHEHDGWLVSFWRFVEHERYVDDRVAAGRSLRELHSALERYPRELPPYVDAAELRAVLAGVAPSVHADAAELTALAGAIDALGDPLLGQPLHGDVHLGNVLWTRDGPLWGDLENVCRGPVEYDLASLSFRTPPRLDEMLRAYGAVDPQALARVEPALCVALAVWTLVLAADDRLAKNPEPRVRVERALAYAREM